MQPTNKKAMKHHLTLLSLINNNKHVKGFPIDVGQ